VIANRSIIRWIGRRRHSKASTRTSAFALSDFSPAPQTRLLILQPTPFCNISCDYCYLPNRSSRAHMALEVVRAAAQRLLDAGLLADELSVVWHAGEPLVVRIDWYEQAFEVLADVLGAHTRITHSVQTNATLIDEDWCRFFLRHGVRIGVSVDGPALLHDAHRKTRGGKGTHHQVLRGMQCLRSHGIPFHAIAVVTRETFEDVDAFIDFFEAQGLTELGCNFDEAEGLHAQSSLQGQELEHGRFLKELLRRSQLAGSGLRVRELSTALHLIARPLPQTRWRNSVWPSNAQTLPFAMLTVAHDGHWSTFSPELLGQASPSYGNFVFGNVLSDDLLEAAQGEAFDAAWHDIVEGIRRCEQGCAHFAYCGGGSPANKFFENGSMNSAETLYCRMVLKQPFDLMLGALESSRPLQGQEHISRMEAV
jgi:uncharacterized protein